MRTLKKETRIKRRFKALQSIFENIETDKQIIAENLIKRAVEIEFHLDDLAQEIKKNGFIETYQNGNNQFGTKESTASKSYNSLLKNYNAIIRTLLSILPETQRKEISDGFDEFLNRQ